MEKNCPVINKMYLKLSPEITLLATIEHLFEGRYLSKFQLMFLYEAAIRGVLWKKVFLEISQNSQENTCARVSF